MERIMPSKEFLFGTLFGMLLVLIALGIGHILE